MKRSKDHYESLLVNRHNTNKPIVYHFSKMTPREEFIRNIGREAISLWNQVFSKSWNPLSW